MTYHINGYPGAVGIEADHGVDMMQTFEALGRSRRMLLFDSL